MQNTILSAIYLFEVSNKTQTVEYMYFSGIILALMVFGATYFHRQFGLISLLLVGLICIQDIESPAGEVGQYYISHWIFSCRMTFILSVLLFFTAIILKREIKKKNKLG